MNILIISSQYPPINKANLYTENMALHYAARQWVKMGHKVFAFPLFIQSESFLDNPNNTFSKKIFETVADNVSLFIKDFKRKKSDGSVKKSAIRKAAKQYRRVLKELPPIDLAIVHSPSSTYDFADHLRLSCPKAVVFDTRDCKRITVPKLARYHRMYNAFGYTLESVKTKIESIGQIDKPSFITRSEVPHFVMPEQCDKQWNSDIIRLVFAGELAPHKNIDVIINALSKVDNRHKFHLDIIGMGSMEPALRRLVVNNGLTDIVTFNGSMLKSDVFSKFRSSDVFVMASSHLSFGLSYLEAMSQGCIALCVETERIDGIIQDGVNGYILKAKDVEALTSKLNEIAALSADKFAAMSAAAVETASSLTEEQTAARYIEEVLASIEKK
ncbi:MAG: glycosyltransferase [Clostridia bacterium]|nr:glycosyltransferase [Clostridia bacterium]